ncbi:MAG: DNA replication/repair protein RecF [Proteobacteria bacterium]|nr:MAG: DNA replication/repair protein RecF [Pseudomonadota bacterium]
MGSLGREDFRLRTMSRQSESSCRCGCKSTSGKSAGQHPLRFCSTLIEMYIERLRLYNFRNLADAELHPEPGVNLITGQNGQGKTNLIEALFVLATGKSFRTSNHKELPSRDSKEASVFADVRSHDGERLFELGLAISAGKRQGYFNKKRAASLIEYFGRLACVAFYPQDVMIIKGAPSLRRRFFDRHMAGCFPSTLEALSRYEKALMAKNALLSEKGTEPSLLDPWNAILAEYGHQIRMQRERFLARLSEQAQAILKTLSGDREVLGLSILSRDPASEIITAEAILEQLHRAKPAELRQKKCLIGPHRDDILITLNGADSRAYASQGQSRSLILALKLATISLIEQERGEAPLILLDDVDSELDSERAQALLSLLLKDGRQTFITATSAERMMGLRGGCPVKHFEVASGQIMPRNYL